jgi:hypothetical protein
MAATKKERKMNSVISKPAQPPINVSHKNNSGSDDAFKFRRAMQRGEADSKSPQVKDAKNEPLKEDKEKPDLDKAVVPDMVNVIWSDLLKKNLEEEGTRDEPSEFSNPVSFTANARKSSTLPSAVALQGANTADSFETMLNFTPYGDDSKVHVTFMGSAGAVNEMIASQSNNGQVTLHLSVASRDITHLQTKLSQLRKKITEDSDIELGNITIGTDIENSIVIRQRQKSNN